MEHQLCTKLFGLVGAQHDRQGADILAGERKNKQNIINEHSILQGVKCAVNHSAGSGVHDGNERTAECQLRQDGRALRWEGQRRG